MQGTTTGLSQRWRHEEAAAHGLNHRWRHDDAADHSALALNKSVDVHTLDGHPGGWHHVHTLDDHPGGWHTNRGSWRAILVSHLAILCRDPKRFGPAIATRGGAPTTARWTIRDVIRRPACSCDSRRVPTTTRIQSEAQDRVTGSFSNGRVPYTGLDTTA